MFNFVDVQSCTNNINVSDIGRRGDSRSTLGRQVIVPSANFTCNGRITNIMASSSQHNKRNEYPFYQIWHPISSESNVYTRIGEIQLDDSHATKIGSGNTHYWLVNIEFTNHNRIEFSIGDIIGHYDPLDSQFRLWSITSNGYTAYSSTATDQAATFNTSSAEFVLSNQQPLIQVSFGMINMMLC